MTVFGEGGHGGAQEQWAVAAVAAESRRFVALVEGADLSVSVPGCPGWTLLDLVRHTGSLQRWFSVLLRTHVQEPPATRAVELELPERDDAYGAWLAASAELAARAFAEVDLDAPMWTWGADPYARFWVRRMLHETLVHRVDAESALGLPSVIESASAADGVDEFLVNLPFATPFAPGVARLRGQGEVIRFRAVDSGREWLVRLRPDGFGLVGEARDGRAVEAADASVHGSAADLLLLLYGRLGRDSGGFEVAGDGELLERWFANSAF
ncbi:maleylpyruvate isomerase family mycothiol-dependent enzyme [Streptomyces sp. WAC 01529]|uniref:maleylpyruvate isomerase family mycothiol-dependent enzyme n=1 Tax=Streptomyces sp. WAC 01529 TaxID=2203205 RepID=UPI000F6F99F8|nr:maleylpyruvate isomerase family mycothiol-dependent enzyme [Streptomyces sp. WAC 01529]AZM53807.1 maleylpyruvate isomerase family mycothiol-dependent enzyme [Streptomyces sp. WAC 01529]